MFCLFNLLAYSEFDASKQSVNTEHFCTYLFYTGFQLTAFSVMFTALTGDITTHWNIQ